MSDNSLNSLLHKYSGDRNLAVSGERDLPMDPDAADDHGGFGWLRGVRDRALMLELRKRTGNILGLPYGYIEAVEFNPSVGITLHTAARKIVIRGRNLNLEIRPQVQLISGLCRHRIAWIQEANQIAVMMAEKDKPVIESISWETLGVRGKEQEV